MKEIIKQKAAFVEAIAADLQSATAVMLVDYRGATVAEITALRSKCRQAGTKMHVLKNTLVRRAAEKAGIEGLEPILHGPTALFYSTDDPAAGARIVREFIAKNKKMQIKAGVVGTEVIGAARVEALADLPSKEVLVAKLLGTLNRPAAGFVGVLSAVPRSLVTALDAVRKQKEEAAA